MIALSISMPEGWSGSILYCESRFFYVSGLTNLQPWIFPDEIYSNQSRKKTPSFPSYLILYFQKFFSMSQRPFSSFLLHSLFTVLPSHLPLPSLSLPHPTDSVSQRLPPHLPGMVLWGNLLLFGPFSSLHKRCKRSIYVSPR